MKRTIVGLCSASLLAGAVYFGTQADDVHLDGRSPHWPAVRAKHLLIESVCAVCGRKKGLEVHHIQPFHKKPELELEDSNLITLCEDHRCHFIFGHLMDWKSWNEDVKSDAEIWRKKLKERPR